jgi:tRNA dimethylallyltransferase|nr:tRNA (adenosine(37)-N6)-dimethylallyltransferase MiaA [Kofleriaceae bacterium]
MTAPTAPRPKLLVVVGPTGAGKTRLAIALAARVSGEIVSADSQQVYVGMDIGTGKASAEERARVPHHLLDVVRPDEDMTAARFVDLADAAIARLAASATPIIIAGGTGLYVRALLLGLFDGPPASPELRAELARRPPADLHAELVRIDPPSAAKIDPNDAKRIVRALEVFHLTGEPISVHQARHDHRAATPRYEARFVGLAPPRDALYAGIDRRVDSMIEAGLEAEVAALRAAGYTPPLRSQQAIGYSEFHDLAANIIDRGVVDRARAIELIKRNSRHYARRQLSWYRNDATITWHPSPDAVDLADLAAFLVVRTPGRV